MFLWPFIPSCTAVTAQEGEQAETTNEGSAGFGDDSNRAACVEFRVIPSQTRVKTQQVDCVECAACRAPVEQVERVSIEECCAHVVDIECATKSQKPGDNGEVGDITGSIDFEHAETARSGGECTGDIKAVDTVSGSKDAAGGVRAGGDIAVDQKRASTDGSGSGVAAKATVGADGEDTAGGFVQTYRIKAQEASPSSGALWRY